MRIFISAGEASGDAYGAALVREIKRLSSDPSTDIFPEAGDDVLIQDIADIDSLDIGERKTGRKASPERSPLVFEGVGGSRMKAEQVSLHADSSKWGAVSITQAAKVYFRIWVKFQVIKAALRKGKPGLLIPIDFGFANIRIARYAKAKGWKVLYFIPPGSWRRDKQGADIPVLADEIVTPFQWSAEMLSKMGGKAHWFGHPIKQLIEEQGVKSIQERRTVAVLPGSRHHELALNLPLIAKAISAAPGRDITANLPGASYDGIIGPRESLKLQLEFALTPSANLEQIKGDWNKLAPGRNDIFTVGDTYGVLSRATAGIVCSGTATLEAALCYCPMVVVYQISAAMRFEAKLIRFKRPKFIALPNIILDREVVPELVEEFGVSPQVLRGCLDKMLYDEAARGEQFTAFEEIDRLLGGDRAITETAKLALKMV